MLTHFLQFFCGIHILDLSARCCAS